MKDAGRSPRLRNAALPEATAARPRIDAATDLLYALNERSTEACDGVALHESAEPVQIIVHHFAFGSAHEGGVHAFP